jgi:hypothetical protein
MKKAIFVIAVGLFLAGAAPAINETEPCPIDGATMFLQKLDYSNGHTICVYQHTTIGGEIHRFSERCE